MNTAVGSQSSLKVLVIEDEDSVRSAICLNLEHAGYACRSSINASQALNELAGDKFDIVLCDLKLPDTDGLSFVRTCREGNPDLAIILMTGFGSSELAIEAMKAGAYDYLSKPFSMEELVLTLRKIEERERLRSENEQLRSAIEQKYSFANIVARSKSMQKIFDTVKRLSNFNTTVLLKGESGTGKELLARAIHHNSPRRGKPFVAINCGAIPETLMESELFGHRKGAFTDATRDKIGLFEEANLGTIFLDEIGELPAHLQVKLLRVIQEQQLQRVGDEKPVNIDVRIIAATLRDLEEDVHSGRFRDDLYYRLNVVTIDIAPLRERTEDIPVLIEHFMRKHNKKLGLKIKLVEADVLKCLMNYHWRGNVRELENVIERALVLTDTNAVDLAALPEHIRACGAAPEGQTNASLSNDNLSIKQHMRALEQDLIVRALKKTGGNRTHAAKVLEISHRALLYKLKEYGLEGIGKGRLR